VTEVREIPLVGRSRVLPCGICARYDRAEEVLIDFNPLAGRFRRWLRQARLRLHRQGCRVPLSRRRAGDLSANL